MLQAAFALSGDPQHAARMGDALGAYVASGEAPAEDRRAIQQMLAAAGVKPTGGGGG